MRGRFPEASFAKLWRVASRNHFFGSHVSLLSVFSSSEDARGDVKPLRQRLERHSIRYLLGAFIKARLRFPYLSATGRQLTRRTEEVRFKVGAESRPTLASHPAPRTRKPRSSRVMMHLYDASSRAGEMRGAVCKGLRGQVRAPRLQQPDLLMVIRLEIFSPDLLPHQHTRHSRGATPKHLLDSPLPAQLIFRKGISD